MSVESSNGVLTGMAWSNTDNTTVVSIGQPIVNKQDVLFNNGHLVGIYGTFPSDWGIISRNDTCVESAVASTNSTSVTPSDTNTTNATT
jgi:hypothetical protein